LVLADVKQSDLITLWKIAVANGLASPNIGLLSDMISCPGAEFCTLANARSIPLAKEIAARFDDLDFQHDIGDIELNISGCMNACGHNSVGNIGITGVEKKDHDEWYQISLGGSKGNNSSIGKIIGPSFAFNQVPEVIDRLLQVYLRERIEAERFIDTVRRIGIKPFKDFVYATEISGGQEEDTLVFKSAKCSEPYYSPRF
jgi:sulfite reductase (NADPH) hemoprotein beta-component